MEYSAPKEREAFRARQRVAMGQQAPYGPSANCQRASTSPASSRTTATPKKTRRVPRRAREPRLHPRGAGGRGGVPPADGGVRGDEDGGGGDGAPRRVRRLPAQPAVEPRVHRRRRGACAARRLKLPFEKLIIPPSATEQLRVFEVHQQRRRAYLAMLQAEVDRRSGKVEVEGDAKLAARRAKREAASAAVATKPKAAAAAGAAAESAVAEARRAHVQERRLVPARAPSARLQLHAHRRFLDCAAAARRRRHGDDAARAGDARAPRRRAAREGASAGHLARRGGRAGSGVGR